MEASSKNVQNGTFTLDLTDADRTPPLWQMIVLSTPSELTPCPCLRAEAESWPMSYLLYATVYTNQSNPVTGCPSVKELLNILFWTQTNTAVRPSTLLVRSIDRSLAHHRSRACVCVLWQAVSLATARSYSILPVPLLRLLLNAFPIVQCNARKSFSTAAVMGVGAPLAIYPSWAYAISPRGSTSRTRVDCAISLF
jgi:hypothetical protein